MQIKNIIFITVLLVAVNGQNAFAQNSAMQAQVICPTLTGNYNCVIANKKRAISVNIENSDTYIRFASDFSVNGESLYPLRGKKRVIEINKESRLTFKAQCVTNEVIKARGEYLVNPSSDDKTKAIDLVATYTFKQVGEKMEARFDFEGHMNGQALEPSTVADCAKLR